MNDYGQDVCPVYLAALNAQVKKYVEKNYPDFYLRADTACNVQLAALKVIFEHAYKGEQESISFALNLKQHLPGADVSTFVASAVVASAVTKPEAVSHPSRAKKT